MDNLLMNKLLIYCKGIFGCQCDSLTETKRGLTFQTLCDTLGVNLKAN